MLWLNNYTADVVNKQNNEVKNFLNKFPQSSDYFRYNNDNDNIQYYCDKLFLYYINLIQSKSRDDFEKETNIYYQKEEELKQDRISESNKDKKCFDHYIQIYEEEVKRLQTAYENPSNFYTIVHIPNIDKELLQQNNKNEIQKYQNILLMIIHKLQDKLSELKKESKEYNKYIHVINKNPYYNVTFKIINDEEVTVINDFEIKTYDEKYFLFSYENQNEKSTKSTDGGGSMNKKYKKTDEKFVYQNRKYNIYEGKRKGKYIKSKGEYLNIKSLPTKKK